MKKFLKGIIFFAVLTITTIAYGQVWDETIDGGGDAGDFPVGDFQGSETGSAFDVITGELSLDESDAYLITIESAIWSADVFDGININGESTDTRSWLFDTEGNFLMFNEDVDQGDPGFLQSFISDTASFPGTGLINNPMDPEVGDQVVLVINSFDDNARDTNGNLIVDLVIAGFSFQALHGYDPTLTNGVFATWSYDNLTPEPGTYSIRLKGASFRSAATLLGDVNCDGLVNLLDVVPFVEAISGGPFNAKADINSDGNVNLLDVAPFIDLLAG